jgi:transposase
MTYLDAAMDMDPERFRPFLENPDDETARELARPHDGEEEMLAATLKAARMAIKADKEAAREARRIRREAEEKAKEERKTVRAEKRLAKEVAAAGKEAERGKGKGAKVVMDAQMKTGVAAEAKKKDREEAQGGARAKKAIADSFGDAAPVLDTSGDVCGQSETSAQSAAQSQSPDGCWPETPTAGVPRSGDAQNDALHEAECGSNQESHVTSPCTNATENMQCLADEKAEHENRCGSAINMKSNESIAHQKSCLQNNFSPTVQNVNDSSSISNTHININIQQSIVDNSADSLQNNAHDCESNNTNAVNNEDVYRDSNESNVLGDKSPDIVSEANKQTSCDASSQSDRIVATITSASSNGQNKQKRQIGEICGTRIYPFGAPYTALSIVKQLGIPDCIDHLYPNGANVSAGTYIGLTVATYMSGAVPQSHIIDTIGHSPAIDLLFDQTTKNSLIRSGLQRAWNYLFDDVGRQSFVETVLNRAYGLAGLDPAEVIYYDGSNSYTYISILNKSELAEPGHSKEGQHSKRLVGYSLAVEPVIGLPVWLSVHSGGKHDSKCILDDYENIKKSLKINGTDLTVFCFDKGTRSKELFLTLDSDKTPWITSLPPHEVEELIELALRSDMTALDTEKNRRLAAEGKAEQRTLGVGVVGEFCHGANRLAVVTISPQLKARALHNLHRKLDEQEKYLEDCKQNVSEKRRSWRNADTVQQRIERKCKNKGWTYDMFKIILKETKNGLGMRFARQEKVIEDKVRQLGIRITVGSDAETMTPEYCVGTYDNKYIVEFGFHDIKMVDLIRIRPIHHFMDNTITVYITLKVLALAGNRLLEKMAKDAGIPMTAKQIYSEMKGIQVVEIDKVGADGRIVTERWINDPNETQAKILSLLGVEVKNGNIVPIGTTRCLGKFGLHKLVGAPKKTVPIESILKLEPRQKQKRQPNGSSKAATQKQRKCAGE